MQWLIFNNRDSSFAALLAAEREVPAVSLALQNRILERAMLSLEHYATLPLEVLAPSPRRLNLGLTVAAVVMLTGLCAAGFVVGYQSRGKSTAKVVAEGWSASPGVSQLAPEPSEVVALVPVPASTTSASSNSETLVHSPRVSHQTQAERATTASNREAFAVELRVLQSARQAVARHEYSTAVALIAEHRRLYHHGVLTEEREALRIRALVGLGRVLEAERAGSAFRERFPRSALIGRIDEMLETRQ